jgi:alpha-amylase/alpha-mannosidase (GH57 family)
MEKYSKKILILTLILLLIFPIFQGCKSSAKPLNVIIVWHNHQPFYINPVSNNFILPWVRLHGVKDYYRMPLIVSKYPDIKVTFDLSGSLIEQINMYLDGLKDNDQIISHKKASSLSLGEKWQILQIPGGFFDINWDHILKKIPMYNAILNKRNEAFKKFGNPINKEKITQYLSDQDYTNLIALFNLFWMDTDYVKQELNNLYNKAMNNINFTEQDIALIMEKQMSILSKIFTEYKNLLATKQIELVTTPYSHPISPLLVDFGLANDLATQIEKTNEIFQNTFGSLPKGTWASECALNDEVLKMFAQNNWDWTISDTDNLQYLGVNPNENPLSKYVPYNINNVSVFFRDKYLSDGISFRYSGKSTEEAINDIKNALTELQKQNKDGNLIYTIALDGENAWEYYPNDGNDFLNAFYQELSSLQKDGIIKTTTPSLYTEKFGKGNLVAAHKVTILSLQGKNISGIKSYSNLPNKTIDGFLQDSSWVNPTLDTWIGEPQENIAWMWLINARDEFLKNKSKLNKEQVESATKYLLIAEGSDWFWWYGSDQDSGNDPSFDRLFKLYLANIYKNIDQNYPLPSYLYGNFFPDGTPYKSTALPLEENKTVLLPTLQAGIQAIINFNNDKINIDITNPPKLLLLDVFDGRSTETFFPEQKLQQAFLMNPFPYETASIGIPIQYELSSANLESHSSFSFSTTNFDKNNLYIALATLDLNKELIPITSPVQLELPIKIQGQLTGELYDEEGDDNGPGTYTYPLNDVFKNSGLFDLVSFSMIDSGQDYILQFKMGNIGGNPWNGPNGFSFQIIEVYIDYMDGGSTNAIDTKGPVIQFSEDHKWDIALRIAGWSYGNFIMFSDGKSVQGELGVQCDQQKNIITVSVPKKYLELSTNYKPYISIISGSQDGYGPGYWRMVGKTASEWGGGGADSEALNAGISPNIYDIFVPQDLTQNKILTGYDIQSKTLARIPYLPLEKAKETPKLTGTINLNGKLTPGSNVNLVISVKNIGKGVQPDNQGNEAILVLPEYLKIKNLKTEVGKATYEDNKILWNGSVAPTKEILISITLELDNNVPNAALLKFKGTLSYDEKGTKENTAKTDFEKDFTVKYPVKLEIYSNSSTFKRNGIVTNIDPSGKNKIEYKEDWGDLAGPIENIIKALGGTYIFDKEKNKITITFMDNTYEHWINQNKSLMNGTAIPLFPDRSDIKSYLQNGVPFLPLKSIAYAFGFTYNVNIGEKSANLNYLP